jgi:hypothetical protein
MVTPGQPQAGQTEKGEEIEVELPRPAHRGDIAKELRQEVDAVSGDGNRSVARDNGDAEHQEQAEQSHQRDSLLDGRVSR